MQAYQNSAYNQGRDAYQGHASEIPHPPLSFGQRSQSVPCEPVPRGKPPQAPRFKSELRVTPEDEGTHRRASDPVAPMGFGSKTSGSSLGSISSDASSGPSNNQLSIRNKHLSYDGGSSVDSDPVDGLYNPPTPARSSSHKVVISHLANLDHRSGSVDSLSRLTESSRHHPDNKQYGHLSHIHSSYENVLRLSSENLVDKYPRTCGSNDNLSNLRHSRENLRHSSDNLLGQSNGGQCAFSKSVTSSKLPGTGSYSRLPPYTRSHTTSALTDPSMSATIMPEPSHPVSAVPLSGRQSVSAHGLHMQAEESRPIGVGHQRYADRGYIACRYHDNTLPSQPVPTGDPTYGTTVTVRFHEGSATNRQVPIYPQTHDRVPMPASVTITSGRPSSGDQTQNINLVTERLKKYTGYGNGDLPMPADKGGYRVQVRQTSAPQMGYDSVASRVAVFEQSDDNLSGDEKPPRHRKISVEERHRKITVGRQHAVDRHAARMGSPPQQTLPPTEIQKIPATPPATISIYFRSDTPTQQTAILQPSPERLLRSTNIKDYSDSSADSMSMEMSYDRDCSPVGIRQDELSPISSRRHKPALRQASYLSAVNSPHSQGIVAYINLSNI